MTKPVKEIFMNAKVVQVLSVVVFVCFVGAFRVQALTHMGQPPSSHVTLENVGGIPGFCGGVDFARVLPDGTSAGIFRVPAGQVLVVTDVDWEYAHPQGKDAKGTIQVLTLSIQNIPPAGENDPEPIKAFQSTITLNFQGQGGTSEHMTSGFVVSSSARICLDVHSGPASTPSGLQSLLVRGYLTPDN
jgi:hypothetical protein